MLSLRLMQRCARLAQAWMVVLAMVALVPSVNARDNVDPALRQYLSANGLLNRGMNELAVAEYRRFLTEHAAHEKAPLARYGLSVALFRLRQFDQALVEIKPLTDVRDFEFAAETLLILGQCQLEQKAYAGAATTLHRLVNDHADHEQADDAAALLADAQYRASDFKAVMATHALIENKWPQSSHRPRVALVHGLALMAQENYAHAASHFAQMQQQWPKEPSAIRVSLLLAQSLHRSDDPGQAAKHYQAVIDSQQAEYMPDALLGQATLLQQRDQPKEAAVLLDTVLAKFPSHRLESAALVARGRVSFDLEEYEPAIALFERAVKADESTGDETSYWIARSELRLDKPGAAAARLKQALDAYPASPLRAEMLYDRAVALSRTEQRQAAIETLGQFQSQFPAHVLRPDALYMQAMLEHQLERYDVSAALCEDFERGFVNHRLTPDMIFLQSENDLLAHRLDQAVAGYQRFLQDFPNSELAPKAKFRLGTALYRQDKFEQATAALAQVTAGRETPEEFRRALYLLGEIRFRAGQWEEAARLLSEYLSFGLDQQSADDALLKRALAQLRQDVPDAALADFGELIERFPKSLHRVQAIFERGQIQLRQSKVDEAEASFKLVLAEQADPRFAPHAMNHLASIALQRQKYSEAAEWFGKAVVAGAGTELEPETLFQQGQALMSAKDFAAADAVFATLLQKHASHDRAVAAQSQRAIALSRQDKEQQALDLIGTIKPDALTKLDPALHAALLYEKAWCLRDLERDDEAAQAYRELIKKYEDDAMSPHAMLELAEMEADAKRPEAAIELLTHLRDLAPDRSPEVEAAVLERAHYRLAACEFELQHYDSAASLCEQFVRDYPDSKLLASARLFAGESNFKLGKHQQSVDHFNAIVQNHPDDPSRANSLLRLGESQAALNHWPDSERAFATYLEKFGDSELWFQARFGIGWAHENQGRHEDAIKAYREVVDRHAGPTAARAQFQIGECLYAKQQYSDAVRELLKVDILYGYPEWSAAALFEAGRCFESLNKPAEAQAQFEQVKQKYPDSNWAKLAAERLVATNGGARAGGS